MLDGFLIVATALQPFRVLRRLSLVVVNSRSGLLDGSVVVESKKVRGPRDFTKKRLLAVDVVAVVIVSVIVVVVGDVAVVVVVESASVQVCYMDCLLFRVQLFNLVRQTCCS